MFYILWILFFRGYTFEPWAATEAKRSQPSVCWLYKAVKYCSVGPVHDGVFYFWTSLHVLCPCTRERVTTRLLKNYHRPAVGWTGWCGGRGSGLVYIVIHTIWFSVRHRVQSQRRSVLLRPQTEVLDARGLAVVAGEAACSRRLQQRAAPHLLRVVGQGLVVGRAGQRAQRRGGHVNIHPQVGEWRWGREVEGRVVHQVVGGGHVLAELLLQTKQAERGRRIRVALRERTAAGQAADGGGHGRRDQGRVWTERRGDLESYIIPVSWRQSYGWRERCMKLVCEAPGPSRDHVCLPGFGLSLLHAGETSPGVTALSRFASSLWGLLSSSLSVALSSVADSLPECSADVTFSSMSSGSGRTGPSASREEEEEEEEEGGSWLSGRTVVEGVASSFSLPPSPDASFCFWSCSFWRLRCFLRNLALRFLNQTWWMRGEETR